MIDAQQTKSLGDNERQKELAALLSHDLTSILQKGYTPVEIYFALQTALAQVGQQAGLSVQQQLNMMGPLAAKTLLTHGYDITTIQNMRPGSLEMSLEISRIVAEDVVIQRQ